MRMRVTMRHRAHSYCEALICIHKSHEAGNRWVHVFCIYIKNMRYLCSDYIPFQLISHNVMVMYELISFFCIHI